MSFTVVIPARFGSSRLPGKPLADIAGKPMVQRVYEQACESAATRVVVATDDARIVEVARGFGADTCLTRADHPSGTDRIEEVARQLQLADEEIVVNVQGDEPLIPPAVINQVASNLAANSEAGIATLSEPLHSAAELFNPNIVKVVADTQQLALYFSRAAIPWDRDAFADGQPELDAQVSGARHLGIYAYRVAFLHRFVQWPPAALEQLESLEQLRALANGVRIHVENACAEVPPGVDTEADLEHVRRLLAS
ncbi:3-deoxy-manno-octulosonate cytidylyltransferase [Halieaceae bacterium IMCC14734]|uniref:3-deoxy-manno-octulosonate cytidylyltransferase n=1 Tax=Candidatus Litorirhabdus singularis TaxID=2518993 RepID=A0ABT3TGJ9_9GAMM|nr:3-deoxy-manno-octulosonate cytidylyltransferase [Candidatus Litorirhabdus singularis]MCX2981411.1 3-deoxy-manno-octulosonate cytidylyltransferase [Candidatus Litorirhabdus singularis]